MGLSPSICENASDLIDLANLDEEEGFVPQILNIVLLYEDMRII